MSETRSDNSIHFPIDTDGIEEVLMEANQPLTARCDELLSAIDRLPDKLDTDEEIRRAKLFARQIEAAGDELRRVRLASGKPFRSADAVVKKFFRNWEKPLNGGLYLVLNRLTDVANHRLSNWEEDEQNGLNTGGSENLSEPTVNMIHDEKNQSAAGTDIKVRWSIEGFDRSTIDLNELRHHISDAVILTACRKHLKRNGPNKLKSVRYAKVATLK